MSGRGVANDCLRSALVFFRRPRVEFANATFLVLFFCRDKRCIGFANCLGCKTNRPVLTKAGYGQSRYRILAVRSLSIVDRGVGHDAEQVDVTFSTSLAYIADGRNDSFASPDAAAFSNRP